MTTMTKKRVADLEGAQLDWAVAMAGEEWKTAHKHFLTMTLDPSFGGVTIGEIGYRDNRLVCILLPNNPMRQDRQEFSPSTNWEHGGQIVEREVRILEKRDGTAFYNGEEVSGVRWLATCKPGTFTFMGRTPLIAAMRAFVASKLGDEVEVPE